MVGGNPPGLEDWGKRGGHFPHPLGPKKPSGVPGLVLCPPEAPSSSRGPRGLRRRERREDEERPKGRGAPGLEDQGGTRLAFPPPTLAQ